MEQRGVLSGFEPFYLLARAWRYYFTFLIFVGKQTILENAPSSSTLKVDAATLQRGQEDSYISFQSLKRFIFRFPFLGQSGFWIFGRSTSRASRLMRWTSGERKAIHQFVFCIWYFMHKIVYQHPCFLVLK